MEKAKVLYCAQEITPYLPENEISTICRQLPQAIQERGKEIRTFMPRYGSVNERRNQLHEVIRLSGMNLIIDDTDHPLIIKVASIQAARMQVYFIDNEEYFQRKATVADESGAYFADNDERAIFFARGVIETVKKLRWSPDIVHCHGWMPAVIPLLTRHVFRDNPLFERSKSVLTIYDDAFTGALHKGFAARLGAEGVPAEARAHVEKKPNYVNLMKMSIDAADAVAAGSPSISPELLEYAKGTGKPFMEYQSADKYVDAYNELYDSLIS